MSEATAHELGVAALGRALAARELSSVEVTAHLLDRFAGHERLGTALSIDREGALAQAADADRRRAGGASGPLLGVPIAHKDIFVTRDFPSTAGSKMLEGYKPVYESTVSGNLLAAGRSRAATAAAEPPDDPPGTRLSSQGLRVRWYAEFSVLEPIANSSQLSLPSVTVPASARRATTVASNGLR